MSAKDQVINTHDEISATIANGQSLSGEIDLGGLRLFNIDTPSAVTGTALTFQAMTNESAGYKNMYDKNGNEINYVVGASRCIPVDLDYFANVRKLKIRSGTSGTPVNQGQDTTFILGLRGV